MAAQEETEGYAEAMNEAIASATRAESERDALKRKYEPDTGILLCKMLRLVGNESTSYMRVTVRTGGYLLLELVPRVRSNGNLPNPTFPPTTQRMLQSARERPQRAPARCDGTELDRLHQPTCYLQPARRISTALGPSPTATAPAH